jgi:dTDP-4-amino-4,6-dideoxygalactose transaminase
MIPFFDYRPAHRRYEGEIGDAIQRVVASGCLILGPEVRGFEEEFAAYVGAASAVGVNSGTDALTLALRALEIGAGDEVITVANAGVPPIAAIRAAGAMPRLVDAHPETLSMDPAGLVDAINPRTRCILPVHLYGQPAEMDPILALASERGLRVVEDCAQAHGATYRGRHVGTFGDVGCFSFYPTKNLGALGDAGICVTNDSDLAERLRMQRMYGFRDDGHSHSEGFNSRLDELQAAILRVKLRHLDAAVEERRGLSQHYRDGLQGSVYRHPAPTPEGRHAYHLFVVEAPERPRVCAALEAAGIGYGVHYPCPVHRMEAYDFLVPSGELSVAERASQRVLSLPLYPGLEKQAVEQVIELLRSLSGATGVGAQR